ncbi:MAG: DUF1080 domain-containing protein, partial [Akkermansiaceae bacterium]|nr:DUF1080 domain-containing protein [Akkermansiaceae bacterium]
MKAAPIFLLALSSLVVADTHQGESIFNGKDLTGWKVPEGNIWWSVQDGAIVAKSGPQKKGSTLWTEKIYTDFEMECEFRFDGKGDSGVYV